jgi:hypothetical protein
MIRYPPRCCDRPDRNKSAANESARPRHAATDLIGKPSVGAGISRNEMLHLAERNGTPTAPQPISRPYAKVPAGGGSHWYECGSSMMIIGQTAP